MQNRENWIAVMSNGRYIVVDKTTGITIYDAQGYGFKNASKCWNWIRNNNDKLVLHLVNRPKIPYFKGKNKEYQR